LSLNVRLFAKFARPFTSPFVTRVSGIGRAVRWLAVLVGASVEHVKVDNELIATTGLANAFRHKAQSESASGLRDALKIATAARATNFDLQRAHAITFPIDAHLAHSCSTWCHASMLRVFLA
jgi:hypothetical protein